VRFLTFLCGLPIQAGTRKTAINSLKTIKKQIDESLKYFCGGFEISDYGYPKSFFPQGQWNRFAVKNQGKPHMINEHCDLVSDRSATNQEQR